MYDALCNYGAVYDELVEFDFHNGILGKKKYNII